MLTNCLVNVISNKNVIYCKNIKNKLYIYKYI